MTFILARLTRIWIVVFAGSNGRREGGDVGVKRFYCDTSGQIKFSEGGGAFGTRTEV